MENNEDIKIYFKHEQWQNLSESEKTTCKNAYKMYQECMLQGIIVPEPDFMISNQKNGCENIDEIKLTTEERIDIKTEIAQPGKEEFAEIFNLKKYFEFLVEKELKNVYTCGPCYLTFNTKEYLDQHMATCPYKIVEEYPSEGIVPCPFCNTYFTNKAYLENHVKHCRNKYTREPNPSNNNTIGKDMFGFEERYRCAKCSYHTTIKSHFKRHLQMHDGIRPFHCTICDKKFTQNSALKKHIIVHTEEKQFQCGDCNYTCKTKSYLLSHIKHKHIRERGYSCNLCSYKGFHKGNLINHLRTHTKEQPFKCNVCNRKFTQKAHLDRHVNTHLDKKV